MRFINGAGVLSSTPRLHSFAAVILSCFFLLPGMAWACANGFNDGFPRPITLNQKKSALISGTPVRTVLIKKQEWHIPVPAGFTDIETLTQATLPERLHVPAFNLREPDSFVFAAGLPGASATLPGNSLATVTLNASLSEAEMRILRPEAGADLQKFPQEGSKERLTALWQKASATVMAGGVSAGPIVCRYRRGDTLITASATLVERDWEPGEKERIVKGMEESAAKGDYPPPGGLAPSPLLGAEVSLAFPFKGRMISLEMELGPADAATGPEKLKDALTRCLLWREQFLRVNK